MAAFFVSHSSRDRGAAELVHGWLTRNGFVAVFLDFHPEDGIPAGRNWERELYAQIRRADAVLFIGTKASAESRWCAIELAFARSRKKPIFPLLLEEGGTQPLLTDTQWIKVDPAREETMQGLADAFARAGIRALETLEWRGDEPPYPGLHSFDPGRGGVFFGREEETRELEERLSSRYAEGTERFVPVTGSSGVGKSSLVSAGLIPRLVRQPAQWVVAPAFKPETDPHESLGRSLATAFARLGRSEHWRTYADRVRRPGGLAELARDLRDAAGEPSGNRSVLLFLDQAEQLRQSGDLVRTGFIGLLHDSMQVETPLWVVATIRSEYLTAMLEGTHIKSLTSLHLAPLGRDRLPEVIERPAVRAGVEFEEGLVQRIVEDTVQGRGTAGDALPLLAFTLRRVWEIRTEPDTITFRDYLDERVGGVVGALKREADRVFRQLRERGVGDHVLPTLLQLVNVEADRDPTARSVPRRQFGPRQREVVDAFVDARLLATEGEEDRDPEDALVRVAHDALLRQWTVLEDAIRQSRESLELRSRIQRDAREWQEGKRDSSYLLTGQRLADARRWVRDHRSELLDPLVEEFVRTSNRKASRRWRIWVAAASFIALVLLALAALGARATLDAWDEARDRRAARGPTVSVPARPSESTISGTAFSIDQHEVTNAQYRLCVHHSKCSDPHAPADVSDIEEATDEEPVVFVDAYQAAQFCRWIGRRLPTLEEWRQAGDLITHRMEVEFEWTSTEMPCNPPTCSGPWDGRHRIHALAQIITAEDGEDSVATDPNVSDENIGFRCAGT